MHEATLLKTLVAKIEALAAEQGASRVSRVEVTLGALSHFTEDHFREHFEEATLGTKAQGAALSAVLDTDLTAKDAQHVRLESIEVETD